MPIAVVKLPHLDLRLIEDWLIRRGVNFKFDVENRWVRGCLVAYGGKGMIFVDGADPIPEQRFTIAHELAHFMIDYWQPRNRSAQKYGPAVLELFDGLRGPTLDERIHAVLQGFPLGTFTRLIERGVQGGDEATWRAENHADQMALAFLAPPNEALSIISASGRTYADRNLEAVETLIDKFGLPRSVAVYYAAELLKSIGKGPSWTENLRMAR
jgi:Zn-dependent peptidase ImmA (M78 family)